LQAERQGDLDVASALPSERFIISALLPFRAGIEMSRSLFYRGEAPRRPWLMHLLGHLEWPGGDRVALDCRQNARWCLKIINDINGSLIPSRVYFGHRVAFWLPG
jgi:hypothetical protein